MTQVVRLHAGSDRHQATPLTDSEVPVTRWPEIASEELEVARAIADRVVRDRAGEPPSVLHEERLGTTTSSR